MKSIEAFIEENYAGLLDLLETLCKIPAPSHHEEKRAAFCRAWFDSIGIKGAYIDEALNVLCPIGCEGQEDITAFVAHTDTVFPDTEPMPFFDDGEKFHCPGCGDDTASLAAMMYAIKYMTEENIRPKKGVLAVCNSCEEGLGNLKGTRRFMDDYAGRIGRFISFDDHLDAMADVCVGSCRFRVTAKTVGGHSFSNFGNRNAIAALSEIVTAIYQIDIPQDGHSRTTVNVGIISGGTSVNTIAESAEMLCEYRSDNAAFMDIMQEKFHAIFRAAANEETKIEVETVGERPCARDVDGATFTALRDRATEIIESVIGKKVRYHSSSTDCNIPMSRGIPAVCVGNYIGGGVHTREEWVDKESLRKGLAVTIKFMTEEWR